MFSVHQQQEQHSIVHPSVYGKQMRRKTLEIWISTCMNFFPSSVSTHLRDAATKTEVRVLTILEGFFPSKCAQMYRPGLPKDHLKVWG